MWLYREKNCPWCRYKDTWFDKLLHIAPLPIVHFYFATLFKFETAFWDKPSIWWHNRRHSGSKIHVDRG